MKFILFNINDTNKNVINKIKLDNTRYINEVSLSKSILENMEKHPKGFVAKIKYNIQDKNIEKHILKALEGWDKKWQYVLSKDLKNNKYLLNKAQSLLGYKLSCAFELDNNIFKYVDEYLSDKKTLKKHELKVLLVATSNKNLNFTLVNNLLKEYKQVNIYLKETPSSYTLNKIKQINKAEGTTIEIIKKERKAFAEYNIVYFVDGTRSGFPRLRLDKNALVIDISFASSDKFNSNVIFMNEYMEQENVLQANIQNLVKTYDNLELATVIRKIVNECENCK